MWSSKTWERMRLSTFRQNSSCMQISMSTLWFVLTTLADSASRPRYEGWKVRRLRGVRSKGPEIGRAKYRSVSRKFPYKFFSSSEYKGWMCWNVCRQGMEEKLACNFFGRGEEAKSNEKWGQKSGDGDKDRLLERPLMELGGKCPWQSCPGSGALSSSEIFCSQNLILPTF